MPASLQQDQRRKAVLITGASSGTGKATARLFAARGWNVVASMRTPAAETGLTAIPHILVALLDVQDGSSISEAIDASIARYGTIDAVVNNAGFGLFGLFQATPRRSLRRLHEEALHAERPGGMNTLSALKTHIRNANVY